MLSEIVLSTRFPGKFKKVCKFLYLNVDVGPNYDLVKMVHPVRSTCYQGLLTRFMEDPLADRVRVNDRGNWTGITEER